MRFKAKKIKIDVLKAIFNQIYANQPYHEKNKC